MRNWRLIILEVRFRCFRLRGVEVIILSLLLLVISLRGDWLRGFIMFMRVFIMGFTMLGCLGIIVLHC